MIGVRVMQVQRARPAAISPRSIFCGRYGPPVPYQHPLAYLLGLEGIALLRAWAGDHDRTFVHERLAEVRRLLDDPALAEHPGVDAPWRDTVVGYEQWAASYDAPNTLFDIDEPIVFSIVDGLPIGDALDAACGTGRFASHLVSLGHRVVGVDSSPDMLAVARTKLPTADFRVGALEALPVDDASVDLVTSGLALVHVPDLAPVFSELARVLRPGGHAVISDTHHELVFRGSLVKALGPDGEPGLATTFRHTAGDFLRAALSVGLQVRRCEEPGRRTGIVPSPAPAPAPTSEMGDWSMWPWTLLPLVPAAAASAWSNPATIIWHLQLDG